jgi:cell wall-associated NlpC family hydrolase
MREIAPRIARLDWSGCLARTHRGGKGELGRGRTAERRPGGLRPKAGNWASDDERATTTIVRTAALAALSIVALAASGCAPAVHRTGEWAPPGSRAGAGEAAVAYARSRMGAPYCWGGTGPGCYDCSGLTYAAWRWAGTRIPRTSSEQIAELRPVPLDRLEPGDVLWRPGHVAIYAGRGWAIHAPQTGDVVRWVPARDFERAARP